MIEPLVSVHMITYNHVTFIAQSIEGVLQQKTNFPVELIIGEDCSTDGTREIVFDYQKKYSDIIRVITSDKNIGAKNNGIRTMKSCQGKYVAFCEGDDYWHHPYKLQKQVDYLESHPECGMVYSSYDVYHVKTGEKIKDFINYKKWEMPDNMTICDILESKGGRSRGITTCTVMLRRKLCLEILEADPYLHQSGHFLMGDTQIWAEMSTKACIHYISESLATHNITEESATRSKDVKKVIRFGLSGSELQLYLCDKYNLPRHIKLKYKEYQLNCLLRLAFHSKNKELADEVRKMKVNFSLKEWIRYYGAINIVIHYIYRASALFINLFRDKHSQWM
jgi:glycosyltransferase involved in cell wall biosynthesis